MAKGKGPPRGTFVIQILNDQHATWQGTVNWVEQKKNLPFRSTLELIKLIDGALESEKAEPENESTT